MRNAIYGPTDIVMMGPRRAGTFRLVFMSRSFFSDDPVLVLCTKLGQTRGKRGILGGGRLA